ncbi:Monocarboxylate transporter 13 [Myotis davidii]|uniref:Monocarboxylate transporter 13 n=1 Tax=Myotis davidii TaxID=225400 RepID=L5LV51_MYODS|nr:Monocarboxylate transporter 13 [Myotis davidii]
MARRTEPPDGGWGWMVVLSAFFQSALVFGVLRSFSIFFVEFVAAFDEPAARVSWIASIGIAVQQFGSPVGSALSTKFGPRPVVMTGGILAALGMLLASYATSLTHLYLSIGLLSGSGWALTFTPTLACLSRYFSRLRSLAMGLALTGVGLSSFAFAPLFQWLLSYYAWRGTLLLVSAISLHLVACGALLRPISLTEDPAVAGPGAQLASLLHHGPFLRYTVALTLVNTGYFIPYVHLVAHLQDLDWDPLPAAFLLSAPTALVALAVAYGFTSGALTPLAFSMLPELVGTGRIYCGLGLVQMVESIGGLLGAPLSGYLRDVTGNYTASFVVAGAFLLAGSGILITLPHFFCVSAPTSKPQDLGTEAPDTRVPLRRKGWERTELQKDPESQRWAAPGLLPHIDAQGTTVPSAS